MHVQRSKNYDYIVGGRENRNLQMFLKIFFGGGEQAFNEAVRIHFEAKEVCLVNLLLPSFFPSPAQNTGISTLYRNSYGAPAEDIKHNQVGRETKMLQFQCNILYGNEEKYHKDW